MITEGARSNGSTMFHHLYGYLLPPAAAAATGAIAWGNGDTVGRSDNTMYQGLLKEVFNLAAELSGGREGGRQGQRYESRLGPNPAASLYLGPSHTKTSNSCLPNKQGTNRLLARLKAKTYGRPHAEGDCTRHGRFSTSPSSFISPSSALCLVNLVSTRGGAVAFNAAPGSCDLVTGLHLSSVPFCPL